MGENPNTESARSTVHGLDDAEAQATLQAIQAGIGHAHAAPAAAAAQPAAPLRWAERGAAAVGARSAGWRGASWPMVALVSFLAVAAFLAGIALYLSSRHAADQTVAIEKFRLSLDRVEQRIALQSTGAGASARDTRRSHEPTGDELLETANTHYREGRFPDAALAFRAAAAADTGGQLSDEARYRYAASLLKTGDPAGALREFQAVVTGFPGSPYFAASAMETGRLLMDQKNYARARQTLCQLLAVRDRLGAADKDYVERAIFLVGRCLEGEAESLEAAQADTLPVARFGPANAARPASGAQDARERSSAPVSEGK